MLLVLDLDDGVLPSLPTHVMKDSYFYVAVMCWSLLCIVLGNGCARGD